MQNKKARLILSSLVLLSGSALQADDQLKYSSLGSGEDVRENILCDGTDTGGDKTPENKCAQGSCGKSKPGEGKCGKDKAGEGKCGKNPSGPQEPQSQIEIPGAPGSTGTPGTPGVPGTTKKTP